MKQTKTMTAGIKPRMRKVENAPCGAMEYA
jgi:hypothetical protein